MWNLESTEENIRNCFLEDSIGRNKSIFQFIRLICSINESCTIAIDSEWGNGKTFFVKQIKMILDEHNSYYKKEEKNNNDKNEVVNKFDELKKVCKENELEIEPYVSVYYDAWINDNSIDPLMSLVQVINEELDEKIYLESDSKIVSEIAKSIIPKGIVELKDKIDANKQNDNTELYNQVKNQKHTRKIIKEYLNTCIYEKGNQLIIFIDELDRCTPKYALKLLERIKHYFDLENVIFVFSINSDALQHMIKKEYGNEFNAYKYLDRFFDFRLSLPEAKKIDNKDYWNDIFKDVCEAMVDYCDFPMREKNKYLGVAECSVKRYLDGYNYNFDHISGIYIGLWYFVPIIIALRMHDINEYRRFISGKGEKLFCDIITKYDLFSNIDDLLLNEGEKYVDIGLKNTIIINKENRIGEIYKAIFDKYNMKKPYVRYGKYLFGGNVKEFVLETASFLSEFAEM